MAYGLTAGQTTIGAMRTVLRQRTDIVNSLVCTNSELNGFLGSSISDLFDILVWRFENYAIAPDYLFTTDGQTDYYPLPSDFMKLMEVHLQWSASPTGWTRIRRTEMSQVTRFTVPNMVGYYGASGLRYVIRGQTTSLPLASPSGLTATGATGGTLTPSSAYAYRVTATTSVGETIASPIVSVSLGVSDNAASISWATVPGATGYNVYGRATSGAQFIASTSLTTFTDDGSLSPSGALPAANTALYNGPSLWLMPRAQAGQTLRLIYIPRLTEAVESGTATFNNVVDGDTFTIQGVAFTCVAEPIVSRTAFILGNSDAETASNFVSVFNAACTTNASFFPSIRNNYVASVDPDSNIVTISLAGSAIMQPTTVNWSAPTNIGLLPNNTWSNLVDGINHWEEYVIVDAAIKVLDKQDLSSAAFVGRKAQIMDRIETAAANRDAGSPKTVQDTMGLTNGGWGLGGFDGFPGGRW